MKSVWSLWKSFIKVSGVASIETLVTQVFWIAYPSERLLSPVYQSRFYDFWIEAGWIHLISWIQLILKNYLWIVLLTFHGELWHLFTENNLLFIDKDYPRMPNFTFHAQDNIIHLSIDINAHFSCKVTLSMDNVTLCTLYSSNQMNSTRI